MKKSKPLYIISGCIFAFFVIFTIMVSKIGIKPLGVNGTDIGFADINVDFHNKTGLHLDMYDLTDKLSIIIYALMAMFAVIWVVKLFMKKNLVKKTTKCISVTFSLRCNFNSF